MEWLRFKPKRRHASMISRVDEYEGQARVRIAATQLGTDVTPRVARNIVYEWCEFFASGDSRIEDLEFVTRTPARLFDSLAAQTQLRRLRVKWGDYSDLSTLAGFNQLQDLALLGASSVRDVTPLGELVTLRSLEIDSLKHAHNLDALGALIDLERLELGGDWMSIRIAHIDSIGFISRLERLQSLVLHTIVVDDSDYSPLLRHPDLRVARVMETRGMKPTHEALRSAIRRLEPAG